MTCGFNRSQVILFIIDIILLIGILIKTLSMKKFLFLLVVAALTLSSCSTNRRALHQMRNLTETIEARGDRYESEDWEQAYEKYKKIDDKIDNSKLTQEQAKEYGELKGRAVAAFAKSKVEKVVNGIGKYINQGLGILKGIFEGITE